MKNLPDACSAVPVCGRSAASRLRRLVLCLLFLCGLALMHFCYWTYEAPTRSRWTEAVIYLAEDDGLAPDSGRSGGTPITLRLLPADPRTEALAKHLAGIGSHAGRTVVRNRQEKLILLEDLRAMFGDDLLASGRLPEPGAGEVLAGYDVRRKDSLSVEGREFKVVGVLKRQGSPFWNSYILPKNPQAAKWLDSSSGQVKRGVLITREGLRKHGAALKKLPVQGRLTAVSDWSRVEPGPYYFYLLGFVLLLVGGAGVLTEWFWAWSQRANSAWTVEPLVAIRDHWRLFVGLHVAYFGLCVISMAVSYFLRDVQDVLMMVMLKELTGGSGVLGILGKAYGSQNILSAAAVTLGVNFFAGSLAAVSLPSLILPGSGALVAFYRAALWGVLLAPAYPQVAGLMRLHSVTLLLEGEGCILAMFFGLLVPVFLLRRRQGPSVWQRWRHALLINLKGNLFVLGILALAAVFEALEVILQIRS